MNQKCIINFPFKYLITNKNKKDYEDLYKSIQELLTDEYTVTCIFSEIILAVEIIISNQLLNELQLEVLRNDVLDLIISSKFYKDAN